MNNNTKSAEKSGEQARSGRHAKPKNHIKPINRKSLHIKIQNSFNN